MEDEYQRLRIKMNILKKVEYRDLTEHLKTIFGDDYLKGDDDNNIDGETANGEEITGADGLHTQTGDTGADLYDIGQVGEVFMADDHEGDGQDYDFMEVDDYD